MAQPLAVRGRGSATRHTTQAHCRNCDLRMRSVVNRAANAAVARQKTWIKAEAQRHINYVNDTKYSFDAVGGLD